MYKHSCYSVQDADYEVQCPQCLAQFSFPSDFQEVKWAYRTVGPLVHQISLMVHFGALTLRFLGRLHFLAVP